MSMKETDIRKYANLMRELGLTGLEITQDNNVVRLERNIPASQTGQTVSIAADPAAAAAAEAADSSVMGPKASYVSVKSPMVGVFYAAPAENADPFVAAGDMVKKGQTLCIVEAMKLMNEVVSEYDGIIAEICAANGQVVEYGTELFRIRRQTDD